MTFYIGRKVITPDAHCLDPSNDPYEKTLHCDTKRMELSGELTFNHNDT